MRPLPRSDSRSSTSAAGGRDLALALQDERVGGERDHARARALAAGQHDGGGGHRRQPDGVAPHRAAVVHEQAQRAPRRGPAAGDELVRVARPPARNLKGQVEVEVALAPGAARRQPPVAAGGARRRAGRRARTAARRAGGPARAACGSVAAPRSASSATAASGSVRRRSWKRGLVEPADCGETCSSLPVAPRELVAGERAPAALADDVARRARRSASGRLRRGPALAFPGGCGLLLPRRAASGARSARARSPPACARSPPRAAAGRRARRPRRRRTSRRRAAARARRAGAPSPRPSRTRSIAPRTDAPIRTCGCSRVEPRELDGGRRPAGRRRPVTRSTIARSPGASW